MAAERGISAISIITGAFVWASKTGGTETALDMGEVMLDGTTVAEPEAFTTEMLDNLERQDGIRWAGNLRMTLGATGIPAENTAFWVKVTPHSGTPHYYGGADGCQGVIKETGLTALSSGRPYVDVSYQFVAATSADGIKE